MSQVRPLQKDQKLCMALVKCRLKKENLPLVESKGLGIRGIGKNDESS